MDDMVRFFPHIIPWRPGDTRSQCICNHNINLILPEYSGHSTTLRPRQDGRHFPDDILTYIFFNENVWISLTISLKCVRKVRINNIPSLVQIMAWRRPGDKPLSEPMMVSLLTHICVTRPQWVKLASWLVTLLWPIIIIIKLQYS